MTRILLLQRALLASFLAVLLITAQMQATAAAAPTWLGDSSLPATEPVTESKSAVIDVNERGDSAAAWLHKDPANGRWGVQATVRKALDGRWGDVATLSEDIGAMSSKYLLVTIDDRDEVTVLWPQHDGDTEYLVAKRLTGGRWGGPVEVSGHAALIDGRPDIEVDDTGNLYLVWSQLSGRQLQSSIMFSKFSQGTGQWSATIYIADEQGSNFFEPRIDANGRGDAVVTYTAQRAGAERQRIESSYMSQGRHWEAPQRLSQREHTGYLSDVGIDANGKSIAVWTAHNGFETAVWTSFRVAGINQVWQEDLPLMRSQNGFSVYTPRIALNRYGRAAATWIYKGTRANGQRESSAWGATLPPTGRWLWSAANSLSQPDRLVDSSSPVEVEMDSQGRSLAVWRDRAAQVAPGNVPDWKVNASQALDPLLGFRGTWALSVPSVKTQVNAPGLAGDGAGNKVAIWSESSTANPHDRQAERVKINVNDGAGPLQNDLTFPEAGQVGRPINFSVRPLDAWSPIGRINWLFGDGGVAGGLNVAHTYQNAGRYRARLDLADAHNNGSFAMREIRIQ